jgi:hypothetical protein
VANVKEVLAIAARDALKNHPHGVSDASMNVQYELAPAAARSSPKAAVELVTGFLQASLGVGTKVRPEHRATRRSLTQAFREGRNPSNIRYAGYLGSVGPALFGPRSDWEVDELQRAQRRAPRHARLLAEASRTWTDEMLWVFLHACLLRTKMGSGPKARTLKQRKWLVPLLIALGRPALEGEGAALLDRVLRSLGVKVKSPRAASEAPKLPRKLPDDLAGAARLIGSLGLSADELPLGRPASEAELKRVAAQLGARLPIELIQLFRSWNGLGQGATLRVARVAELARMNREFARWRKREIAEKGVIAFGNCDGSSNFLFVDPRRQAKDEPLSVWIYDHADPAARLYQRSVPAAAAAVALQAYLAKDPSNAQLERLLRR